MIPLLVAATATFIVATCILPTFMVYACAKSLNWASSALASASGWLVLLFGTLFLRLELETEAPAYLHSGTWFNTLSVVSISVGAAAFVISLAVVLIQRYAKTH